MHPFLGDYVRLRNNAQWKKCAMDSNDQYVVFADIINKISRSSGKVRHSILLLSMCIKYLSFQITNSQLPFYNENYHSLYLGTFYSCKHFPGPTGMAMMPAEIVLGQI